MLQVPPNNNQAMEQHQGLELQELLELQEQLALIKVDLDKPELMDLAVELDLELDSLVLAQDFLDQEPMEQVDLVDLEV